MQFLNAERKCMRAGVRPGLQILWVRLDGPVGSTPTHFRQERRVAAGKGSPVSSFLNSRQGERDQRIALLFFSHLRVTACRDHNVLLAAGQAIRHGRGVRACRQIGAPEFFSAVSIEGAKVRIDRAGNENQPARRHNRSSQAQRS